MASSYMKPETDAVLHIYEVLDTVLLEDSGSILLETEDSAFDASSGTVPGVIYETSTGPVGIIYEEN